MTDPEEETLMREILKNAATIYANMNIEETLSYVFGNQDIPVLRPSERIRVVLIREHDEPHPPVPFYDVAAGAVGYVTP